MLVRKILLGLVDQSSISHNFTSIPISKRINIETYHQRQIRLARRGGARGHVVGVVELSQARNQQEFVRPSPPEVLGAKGERRREERESDSLDRVLP